MGLDNPASVIYDVFTFETLHLENDIKMQSVVRTSNDTSTQLYIATKKGIATPRERHESNFVAMIWLSIEEPEFTVKHPVTAFIKFLIATSEHIHK